MKREAASGGGPAEKRADEGAKARRTEDTTLKAFSASAWMYTTTM